MNKFKEYPHILYPEVEKVEKDLIDFSGYRTGYTENFFEYKLEKYFKKYILKNVVINDGRKYPYQPDYVFCYEDRELYIDIEIDEPYAYGSKKPIHIDDKKRNHYFLNKGWSIIRFAEIQITKYPELCCKIISEHIRNLTGESIWIEGFHKLDNLEIIIGWNKLEASEMASNSYRQTYLKFLQKVNKKKADINIVADGIFLNNQISETKLVLEQENSIRKFNETAKLSVFLRLLIQYVGHFKQTKKIKEKTHIEFTIYISKYHSFYNFSFDTDFIEIDNYIINIYYIRTNEIICFEILEKIQNEKLKHIMLIADDPAYPSLLKEISDAEIILVRKYRDSFMPNDYKYLNIDNPIENSLEIEYK